MDMINRQFRFKPDTMDLMAATLHLIDSESGAPTGCSSDESLAMSETLLKSISVRFDDKSTTSDIESVHILHNVEFEVTDRSLPKIVRRFVSIPVGVPAREYCQALFGTDPSFIRLKNAEIITPEEMERRKALGRPSSEADRVLEAALKKNGLSTAIESIISCNRNFDDKWPKNISEFSLRLVAVATPMNMDHVHPDCLLAIARKFNVRRSSVKIFAHVGVALVVVDAKLKAITSVILVKRALFPTTFEVLPDGGIAWNSLNNHQE